MPAHAPAPLHLLLPVDGSPAALAAVRQVLAWRLRGLSLHCRLLNVQTPPTLYEVVVAHDREALDGLRAAAGADLLAAAEALLDGAGIARVSEVVGGDPGHAIVEMAEALAVDLVVMGATGQGESSHALGRVAQAVLSASPAPVTVVRAPSPGG